MRKYALFLWLIIPYLCLAGTDDSRMILEKIDAFRIPYEDFLIRTKITSYEHGEIKETAIFDAYISGADKSLVIARQYKTRDMKILYVDEKMWVHLPHTHRPIRITPIQRLMGEASNGDVARVGFGEDYTAEPGESVTIEGLPCRKIKLTARKASATYNSIVLFVREADYRPVKADFHLLSGKHFKTAYYESFKPMGDNQILEKMTIYDALQGWKMTTFEYLEIAKKKIPAKCFNKNYLIHIKEL